MRTVTLGAGLPLATAAIALVTVLNRLGAVPLRDLAGPPAAVADGREWLIATSAFVADRPAVPSIVGFAIVGTAVLLVCGSRVLWTSAIAGHVLSTVAVYAALAAAGVSVTRYDFGTSAVIAAWIGALAYRLHARGAGRLALALCLAAALVGWLFRPDLDLLDAEHAVALPIGVAVAAWAPRLRLPELRKPVARRVLLLQAGLLRH